MKPKLLAFLILSSAACFAAGAYTTYANGRFSFSVEYPNELLVPRGESENGDGQVFASKEGDATLTVFGGWRSKELDFPCDALDSAKNFPGAKVTYKWKKEGASVASGYADGDKVFYVKNILSKGRCVTLMTEYPLARRSTFDPIISRVATSLKG